MFVAMAREEWEGVGLATGEWDALCQNRDRDDVMPSVQNDHENVARTRFSTDLSTKRAACRVIEMARVGGFEIDWSDETSFPSTTTGSTTRRPQLARKPQHNTFSRLHSQLSARQVSMEGRRAPSRTRKERSS